MRSPGAILTTVASALPIIPLIVSAFYLTLDTPRIAGLVIALLGFLFLTIARINLGDSFSIEPRARTLVTTGLYSKVRHPVYVFGLIGITGLFLYLHLYFALLVVLILIPAQIARARAEEVKLTEAFGDAYRDYKARTWF